MIFTLEEGTDRALTVWFPYDYCYPEQYRYMAELKQTLDAKGHCLLEMPTGTGKTVCLIALITAYQYQRPEIGKFIYCTRTVPEMVKCVEEIRRVIKYRTEQIGPDGSKVLALCLSSRRNMCIHQRVMEEADREAVDGACRDMTASWVRQKAGVKTGHPGAEGGVGGAANVELCDFFEAYDKFGSDSVMPSGIYSIEDLKTFGRAKGWCPYFLARHVINHANILVYNYQYMLDPKVAGLVSRELEAESVVVFDEAHNIDNVCTEALSVQLNRQNLEAASRCLGRVSARVTEMKQTDQRRLNEEYQRLVHGLAEAPGQQRRGLQGAADAIMANPVLPSDVMQEAVPGMIRRAEHFVAFMRKILEHLKVRIQVQNVEVETPLAFLHKLFQATTLERKPLKFTYSRLTSLLRTLEVTNLDEFRPLTTVADFATLVSTYQLGFAIVIEPTGSLIPGVYEPILQLSCLDASLAIKPVFERFRSVMITSGTLSPIDLYPQLLNFSPVIRQSLPMSTFRRCICPLVVTRGSDQLNMSTKFEQRGDPSVSRNYGNLLIELASAVPDGVVCFFPSYSYMERIVCAWDESGVLRRVLEKKLVFIETKDVVETTLALDNYKKACNCGRGAIFFSVARGKVAEGIDFDRHYGRAVVMFGVPFQYTLSHVLRARLEYLRATFQIREADFLNFDALRQAAQCVGRVIRSKTDYGLVILADSRYNRHDKRSKLPPWITQFLSESHLNLSTDMAMAITKNFLKEMSQPVDREQLKTILYDAGKLRLLDKQGTGASEAASAAPLRILLPSATASNTTGSNARPPAGIVNGVNNVSNMQVDQEPDEEDLMIAAAMEVEELHNKHPNEDEIQALLEIEAQEAAAARQ